MDDAADRLKAARIAAGFKSASAAAEKIGMSGSTYRAKENKQNGIDIDDAKLFGRAFKVRWEWILDGDEALAPPGLKALLSGKKMSRGLSALLRSKAGGTNFVSSFDPDEPERGDEFEADAPDPVDPDSPASRRDFPDDAIIELQARGGLGDGHVVQNVYRRDGHEIVVQDAIKDEYWRIPPSFLRGALNTSATRLIVIECEGDSMVPAIMPGERVFVDTRITTPSVDAIYAFRNRFDDVVVKRLQATPSGELRIKVLSANADYPPYEVSPDEITIIGRVVGSMKRW